MLDLEDTWFSFRRPNVVEVQTFPFRKLCITWQMTNLTKNPNDQFRTYPPDQ